MKNIKILANTQALPAGITDTETPVSLYLKLRDRFPNTTLLESSDYHGNRNSRSFICFDVRAGFEVDKGNLRVLHADGSKTSGPVGFFGECGQKVKAVYRLVYHISFGIDLENNGLFGYCAYNAVQHFETIALNAKTPEGYHIPEVKYFFYRYIITFDHFNNRMYLTENLLGGRREHT
jgi:anthranilate synthase component I